METKLNSIIDQIEKIENISTRTVKDEELYISFFKKEWENYPLSYGNNWAYITQAARNHPYKYYDRQTLITLSIDMNAKYPIQIIRPTGEKLEDKIINLCNIIKKSYNKPILVKKIYENTHKNLIDYGAIEPNWDKSNLTELPDDIFEQPICELQKYFKGIEFDLSGKDFLNLRQKVKRFEGYGTNWQLKQLSVENAADAKKAVENCKEFFIKRYSHKNDLIIPKKDSYYTSPYHIIIDNFRNKIDNNNYFSYIFYINGIPVGFSFLGRISKYSAAQYCNLCVNCYKGLAEFLTLKIFLEVYQKGFKYVNMGGSTTESLFLFNKKFSPISYMRYYYLIY